MPGYYGAGLGMCPRIIGGACLGLGGIVNIAILGVGIYAISKLISQPAVKRG
ncbi:hypothetical protein [Dendrosporobacter sp. 1207_IL3150]|uniref:hypothetical protein n=1 Tax=Dendrosporobacter sp. 1207_IL3150 TaxID=3084054 RepID=UPI002FD9C3A1